VKSSTVLGIVAISLLLGVVVQRARAGAPAPAAPATVSEASGNPLDPAGFEILPKHIWSEERFRNCGLITLAEGPQYAGQVVTAKLELSRGSAVIATWHFYDPAGNLTLTQQGSSCFTNVKMKRPAGNYRFDFTLPTDPVAFDPAFNAEASADGAFQACRAAHPEKLASDVVVSTLVGADDTLFTHSGTRGHDNLRDCLGKALAAWVEPRRADGRLGPARPLVVKATLPAVAPAAGAPAPPSPVPGAP
jgi:hypothetical protein